MKRLPDIASSRSHGLAEAAARWRRRVGRGLWGDRYGLVLFLGTLTVLATYWRVGVFLNDSYAIANGLVNVADGHLEITRIEYSLTVGSQPGFRYADGAVYTRNYAHIFLSLPVLWFLDALAALFDLRLVLAAGWSGLLMLSFDQLGRLLDRHGRFATVGTALALLAFLGNALVAPPLPGRWTAFLAIQITTLVATAFVGVALYRVLAHLHGRRVGVLFGTAAVLASPVGFWASIPKRHAFSTLAVVTVLGAFYCSRTADSRRRALGIRAFAYAVLALFAWLHALEALVVFAVFVPMDLATARSNHPKHLAVVAVVFLVALAPFLATNAAVSGNPFEPSRTLVPFDDQVDPLDDGSQGDGQGTGGEPTASTPPQTTAPTSVVTDSPPSTAAGSPSTAASPSTDPPTTRSGNTTGETTAPASPGSDSSGSSNPGPIAALVAVVGSLLGTAIDGAFWALGKGWRYVDVGIATAKEEPARLYHIFVRSGRIPEYIKYRFVEQEPIDLALLEVAPLLGGLLGVLGASVRRLRTVSRDAVGIGLGRPARQTDLLAAAMALSVVLMNLRRLPVHTQITVRYLLPLVPLGLYGVARLGCVRRVVRTDLRRLIRTYGVSVLVGGLGFLAANLWLDLALGEAMQLHALVNLAGAGVLAGWALAASAGGDLDTRIGAVALGVPAALSTLFLLFTGFVYFPYAEYALPLAELLVDAIPIAV